MKVLSYVICWLSGGWLLKGSVGFGHRFCSILRERKRKPPQKHLTVRNSLTAWQVVDLPGRLNEINLWFKAPQFCWKTTSSFGRAATLKRRLEAGERENFPMPEEIFLQAGIQSSKALSNSLQAELCSLLESLQNSLEGSFRLDSLNNAMWMWSFPRWRRLRHRSRPCQRWPHWLDD